MPGSKPPQERIVSTYCYQCVAGPDLLTVRIQDGVATEINPNFAAAAIHPGGGKACVKAFGLVQKAYSPNRVLYPMKRTNPKKGRHEDPGFVRISWDEALDLVADKLKAARAAGLTDESGFPRLAASFGGGGTPTAYMGTLPAFLSAWGPVDLELRLRPGRQMHPLRTSCTANSGTALSPFAPTRRSATTSCRSAPMSRPPAACAASSATPTRAAAA